MENIYKLAIHKTNKFCYGLACQGQTEFDEIEVEAPLPESFLDSNGSYKYKWNEVTEELEIADFKLENEYNSIELIKVRSERDRKLAETDWIELTNFQGSSVCKTNFETYRQALRDLPSNIVDIDNFEWPIKPSYEK